MPVQNFLIILDLEIEYNSDISNKIAAYDLLKINDDILKDCIGKLSSLLERDDLDQETLVKIKYERELYSKFTIENCIFY